MNPVPETVKVPSAPQVNLLPPEIEQRRSQGRAKGLILFALIAFVIALGGAWFYAYTARVDSEKDLADAEARRPELTAELAAFDYVHGVASDYENSIMARAWAGATDVDWASQVAMVMATIPGDLSLSSVQITPASPYGGVGGDGTVFAQEDLGQLTFSGQATESDLAADLIVALDALPGFHGAWVDSEALGVDAESDAPVYDYSGSVRITYNALSGRTQTEQTEVDPEVLAAITGEGE
ncbi:hypothetical protein [Demequina mangrovi]|uniref:Tfp pilus assembly protein PilN n=1 Tax=Demequina mangrovi TaxID=1043493 RepID=A0A1H6U208_9MICO|nr:hypothetical protein [Demequina mangrovi]SEI86359.1 hypothetical protein SAMN05421637_0227 [Demequina mangrovi]